MDKYQYYTTTSLSLAALLSLSFPVDSINKANPSKAEFIFKRTQQLDDLIELFWRQEVKVEPQMYFQSLKILKTRLYSSA